MRKAQLYIHHPDELTATVEDFCDQTYPSFIQCTLETEAVKINFFFEDLDELNKLMKQLDTCIDVIRERRESAPEES